MRLQKIQLITTRLKLLKELYQLVKIIVEITHVKLLF